MSKIGGHQEEEISFEGGSALLDSGRSRIGRCLPTLEGGGARL